jgi:diguanylate cyclase (GGDEF)-like protein
MDRRLTPLVREAADEQRTLERRVAALLSDSLATTGCAAVAVTIAIATRSVVAVTGAIGLTIVFLATRRRAEKELLAGQIRPAVLAIALLSATNAGLARGRGVGSWLCLLLAATAYPLLGRTTLRVLDRYRRIRETDVAVEGALAGAAAGIVVQVLLSDARSLPASAAWDGATSAPQALLIGLDVALLVVAVRGLASPTGRRGPLRLFNSGVVLLLSAHLVQALAVARGTSSTGVAAVLAALGIACLAGAALHPLGGGGEEPLAADAALFSRSHAAIVVIALLAVPAVLAVQALRNVTVSATVALGAVLSGIVLASYLVGLLRERAATEHQATHDGLTGLPNRVLFTDRLERAIAHARRNDQPVGVLYIDLDRFKEVNDTFGHVAGDQLLRMVAARLLRCQREEDTVARLSGDEFAVLLPHLAAVGDVLVVVQRVLDALASPVTIAGARMLITASIGVAVHPNDGDAADGVLSSADAAMYRAKETPGNTFEIFSSALATQAHERRRLESALYAGVQRNELTLYYQPVVDLASGRTVGAEALVRWMHPEEGLVLPGQFIPVAEQSDLIVLLGERVILRACEQLRRWAELGLRDLSVAVNVSSRHFNHGLVSTVTAALRDTGADARNLVIELTESTAVDNLDAVAAALEELRNLGVRSAIDDFGTGYCGLRYLSTLPVDCLKIDQSFIQGMTPSAAAIVAATIAMGHSLGLTLIAEGVETAEQHRFLLTQGCDRVQGYLFGRPMPADELTDRLRAEGAQDILDPPRGPRAIEARLLAR